MCCFSRPVQSVSATNIFARAASDERQFIVYSMNIEAEERLAMILPLPVKKGSGENAVEFINLKDYPTFFEDMRSGFPKVVTNSLKSLSDAPATATAALAVVQVGDFEASFVPMVKDFSRLDDRFKLPTGTWDQLPQYKDYGFAVFKLKAGAQSIHPMAFLFPRRDVTQLFFPTVHIHDGKIHEKADFDHTLYAQPSMHDRLDFRNWVESEGSASVFMNTRKSRGIVAASEHCYMRSMQGDLANTDTWLQPFA